jgi:hypothetical protein
LEDWRRVVIWLVIARRTRRVEIMEKIRGEILLKTCEKLGR